MPKLDSQTFISNISGGKLQRENRFIAEFPKPSGANTGTSTGNNFNTGGFNFASRGISNIISSVFPTITGFRNIVDTFKDKTGQTVLNDDLIGIYCTEITLPHKDVETTTQMGLGSPYEIAISANYGQLTATFICSEGHREYNFFKQWLNLVHNTKSNTVNFFDEYVSDITVKSLSDSGEVTNEYKYQQCYPLTISDMNFSMNGTDSYVFFSVSFQVRLLKD